MHAVKMLIYDFVSMLEAHGPIRNMRFWSVTLLLLAVLNFILGALIIVLLPYFSDEIRLHQLFVALSFVGFGLLWFVVGKECLRRIGK